MRRMDDRYDIKKERKKERVMALEPIVSEDTYF